MFIKDQIYNVSGEYLQTRNNFCESHKINLSICRLYHQRAYKYYQEKLERHQVALTSRTEGCIELYCYIRFTKKILFEISNMLFQLYVSVNKGGNFEVLL